MNFSLNDNYYYDNYTPSIKFVDSDFDLTNSGYLYIYNTKTSSDLNLTLPTDISYKGINLLIKNPSLTYSVKSTLNNVKQFDGTVSNIICGTDNYVSMVYDGTNWLICMTN